MNRWMHPFVTALLLAGLPGASLGQSPTANPSGKPGAETQSAGEAAPAGQTEAERVSRLTRTIEENDKRLADLKANLEDPEGEYAKAEAEFKQLDTEFEAKNKEIEKLRQAGRDAEADALKQEFDALTERRKLAEDRFNLAIQERKMLQEQVATLEQKLAQDREALQALLAPPPTATQPSKPPEGAPAEPSASPGAPPTGETPAVPPVPTPGVPVAVPAAPAANGGAASSAEPAPGKPPMTPEQIRELAKAQDEAQTKAAQAAEAEKQAKSVSERIDALVKSIELERKLLDTTRRKAENARDTERTLSDQAQQGWKDGTSEADQQALWVQVTEARKRYRAAQAEVEEKVDRLDSLESELRQLQAEQIATLQQADKKRSEADEARKRVAALESPLAPRNLLRWVVERGPRVLGIVAGMFGVLWLARRCETQIVKLLIGRADRGSHEDRENRAKTLVSVFHSAASIAIIAGGTLMLLSEIGVNIVPLMGGAAVVGLAVAFGAQNLIRDYFYGFMILLESQYTVNDVVKIGDVSGQVERITLRVTVLRGLDGTVHFVPNGEITRVSNMTHGWSRALFDVTVAYKEDVDRVMEVLTELAKELRRDPEFRGLILEMPEMLGVDEFADSAVVIKFFIKTRPLKQWAVKREMLRRIKKRFDELGIEIPFPHRTVYHRHENGAGAELGEGEPTVARR